MIFIYIYIKRVGRAAFTVDQWYVEELHRVNQSEHKHCLLWSGEKNTKRQRKVKDENKRRVEVPFKFQRHLFKTSLELVEEI